MKRIILIVLACLVISTMGCNKIILQESVSETKTLTDSFSDNFVSLEQIHSYLGNNAPLTRNAAGDYEIEPILGKEGDTLIYIVRFNNGEGWRILSADARTPAIIAESEKGSLCLDSDNDGILIWLDGVKKDLSIIRHSPDDNLSFSKEQIEFNKSVWSKQPGLRNPRPPQNEGTWQTMTTTDTIVVESIDHMVPHWYQRQPYNNYCPLKTDGSGLRAKAGCIAIAGAEVLYYLHNKYGEPQTMVSEGYCTGNISSYYREFFSLTSDVWASMDSTFHNTVIDGGTESLLIGHIGDLVHMHYYNSYSWTLPAYLRTNVFNYYGYSCSHDSYDETILKTNLANRLPVIVTATDLLIPCDFDIHTFVIDGFKKTKIKYSVLHYFEPLNPESFVFTPEYQSYYEYSYTTPDITAIKINWGWDTQWDPINPINDGWYSLTGSWYVRVGDSVYDYNYNRQMIYGFALSE